MDLSVREWTCINKRCNATHDRDEAASRNIRAEGIRMLQVDGTATSASGGSVRPNRGRKTKVRQHPAKLETTCYFVEQVVVHSDESIFWKYCLVLNTSA